jgi:hypothetical protein
MREIAQTRSRTIVLAAFVMAVALPVATSLSSDTGEVAGSAALVEASGTLATVPQARFAAPSERTTPDAAHAASMMLVGTLLIGIGSMVRRAS